MKATSLLRYEAPMKWLSILLFFPLFSLQATIDRGNYPDEWWVEIPRDSAPGWEILPQEARPGEVILSKRTALGVFSNFADTPFVLDGVPYASIEGLWQSLKYPELSVAHDPRHQIQWPYTRQEVEMMIAWDAKSAGNQANQIYYDNGLEDVSYRGHFFDYVDHAEGSDYHYELIKRAVREKVVQNPDVKALLLQTKGLRLVPDHFVGRNAPRSFNYHIITMEIRDELLKHDAK
jgi:predicted NAD-dependent protein-ADP-ribosyltransferase YbiA (DUF1768 family)